MTRLYNRRFPPGNVYTVEQARELALISHDIGRQVGLIIDRKGNVVMVIVGTSTGILIPHLDKARQSSGRLSGLRLLHTHLNRSPISEEDLMDMVFLRLDSVSLLTLTSEGEPDKFQWAHILPPNEENKLYQVYEPVHWSRVSIDLAAQTKALEEELARLGASIDPEARGDRALLISVSTLPKEAQEKSLQELAELSRTAGLDVAGTVIQRVAKINPRFILGKGKLAELEIMALQRNVSLLVFDLELSPTQLRNLTNITERKVIDRTQLILDIFAQHASTRAGKLQVEMAQLKYTLPRLVKQNRALSRLTGGIGGRGPGETRLELDRRKIRDRMARIKKELQKLRKHRQNTRMRRYQADVPVIALVGYTNVGKSTLLNTLTHSQVIAENKLFATLDPTSRRLRFPRDREVILTDTVGFIRHLPEDLKQAFMATLEELSLADILVQVADASHPEVEEQIRAVDKILDELNLRDKPKILALNKWDLVQEDQKVILTNVFPRGIPICALQENTLTDLVSAILEFLEV